MFHVAYISNHHDPRLVAVAVFLCVFSCWTTVCLLSRVRACHGRSSQIWTMAASLVFGAGIWSTHFIIMLAFQSSSPITCALHWTVPSIAIAIGISPVGFSRLFSRGQAVSSGALVGLSNRHALCRREGPARLFPYQPQPGLTWAVDGCRFPGRLEG
jgi:NO-binding membrane sensor protein with MHYT domain